MSVSAAETTIRTFRGPDAHSALSAVKAAFGQDAVILETKQVAGGLFSRAQVEIIAASAGGPVLARTAAFEKAVARATAPARNLGGGGVGNTGLGGSREQHQAAGLRRELGSTPLPRERHHDSGQSGRSAQNVDFGNDGLREEIAALRKALQQARPDREWPADARRLFAQLLRQGVDEAMAHKLLMDAQHEGADRGQGLSQHVFRTLVRMLPVSDAPWSTHARRTIAFVGPTGVGKTTAMAKIAARALLESQFKVALITVDTYRVGASDQLARYGKIMGVPTFVARDAQALAAAHANCRDADLVLIDTAGRADAESSAQQAALVRSVPNVQLHLTLSAATGSREIAAAARRYQKLNPERFIFTKLDEADGPASLLAAMAVLPASISCVCDGQRVPEDIHCESSAGLVSRLVGLDAARAGAV